MPIDERTGRYTYELKDKHERLDDLAWRRQARAVLPPGRALDAYDLELLLDTGNETSHARILRARLCEWAAPQLLALILLDEREVTVVANELEGLKPDGTPHDGAARVHRAGIPEWPRGNGG